MSDQDIRWIQRFTHFVKALAQLEEAVQLAQQRPLTKFEALRIKLDELRKEEGV